MLTAERLREYRANRKRRSDNTSGYCGVNRDRHQWRAQIKVCGKNRHIGYFDTAEEAFAAYQKIAATLVERMRVH
jgi:hypothetical protein